MLGTGSRACDFRSSKVSKEQTEPTKDYDDDRARAMVFLLDPIPYNNNLPIPHHEYSPCYIMVITAQNWEGYNTGGGGPLCGESSSRLLALVAGLDPKHAKINICPEGSVYNNNVPWGPCSGNRYLGFWEYLSI